MTNKILLNGIVLTLLISHSLVALSMPKFTRQYQQQFGYKPSCQACHRDGGGSPLNQYGEDFNENGKNTAAFKAIANLDSDQDGITNTEESIAKANPGDKESTPTNTNKWLDLSSLIPKEAQDLFPAATAWKPLDTNFTERDITKAKEIGVTLGPEDDNTIYIPVAERRPIGTALIFPVKHQDKLFFLIMSTTDRKLNVSHISALNSNSVPAELTDEMLQQYIGMPLQSINLLEGDDLQSSITLAVKRAGILVYMRLKGA
jgi:hypothetical protein